MLPGRAINSLRVSMSLLIFSVWPFLEAGYIRSDSRLSDAFLSNPFMPSIESFCKN